MRLVELIRPHGIVPKLIWREINHQREVTGIFAAFHDALFVGSSEPQLGLPLSQILEVNDMVKIKNTIRQLDIVTSDLTIGLDLLFVFVQSNQLNRVELQERFEVLWTFLVRHADIIRNRIAREREEGAQIMFVGRATKAHCFIIDRILELSWKW